MASMTIHLLLFSDKDKIHIDIDSSIEVSFSQYRYVLYSVSRIAVRSLQFASSVLFQR